MQQGILIVDFGSQYVQLIARRIRELDVYCEIHPYNQIDFKLIKNLNPSGIILSGGPKSVLDKNSPHINKFIFKKDVPILGICYGLQALTKEFKGKIKKTIKREYGFAKININKKSILIPNEWTNKNNKVWMSHGDHVEHYPKHFEVLGISNNNIISIISHKKRKIYGLQFHPEVHHTYLGTKILSNFVFKICKAKNSWKVEGFIENKIDEIKKKVGNNRVICGLSGGVDSSVTAHLIHRAIGENLYCIFVDHGLLRKNESDEVSKYYYKQFKKNFY